MAFEMLKSKIRMALFVVLFGTPPRSQGFNIVEDRYKTVYGVRL